QRRAGARPQHDASGPAEAGAGVRSSRRVSTRPVRWQRERRQRHGVRAVGVMRRLPRGRRQPEGRGILENDRGGGSRLGQPCHVTPRLVLLRHGESEWNALDLFTGWVDVGLNEKGRAEAALAGELLRDRRLLPDVLHSSVLRRAIQTSDIALDVCDRHWIPVRRSWRLNERHYGALQGRSKRQTRERYGDEQVILWRRSYDTPPARVDGEALGTEAQDPRYAVVPEELRPRTECLKDVVARLLPYWYDAIIPDLHDGRLVLVSAHGNSLRALVKHLDGISDEEIVGLNIPAGVPLLYEPVSALRPRRLGGEYPHPGAAAAWIEEVRNQGRV